MLIRTAMVLLALSAIFLGCGSSETAQDQTKTRYRVGTDPTYPPFESVNSETAEIEGFDIDLIHALASVNGWQIEFIAVPFDGMIPGLTGGKYDMAISATTITPERAAVVNFSDPYYLAGQILAVPLTDSSTVRLDQLVGRRVGVQLGTTGELMAKRTEGLSVFPFDNIGTAFIDMANGNLDAVLNDLPTSLAYVRAHGTAKLVGEVLSTEQYGILMPKGKESLLRQINDALAQIRANGTYDSLHLKWFGMAPEAMTSAM